MNYRLIILKILMLLLLSLPTTLHARDRVFILTGQSNMQGMGSSYQLADWQKRTPNNVYFYNKGSSQPVPLVQGNRFGPEVGFAHKLSRAFPRDRIYLLKVAAGGTPITQWLPGTSAYRALVHQVLKISGARPPRDAIDAIIWMQGESDAINTHRAMQYAIHLNRVIHYLRRDLNSPNSLFLIGKINPRSDRFPQVNTVRRNQELVQQQLRGVRLVSTTGLQKLPDDLHYDHRGLLDLGDRFAATYLRSRHHLRPAPAPVYAWHCATEVNSRCS